MSNNVPPPGYISEDGKLKQKLVRQWLAQHIIDENMVMIEEMAQAGVDLDYRHMHNLSALTYAIKHRKMKAIEGLLKLGVKTNLLDILSPHVNPYLYAASGTLIDIINIMREYDPPNKVIRLNMLTQCMRNHNSIMLKYMIQHDMFDDFDLHEASIKLMLDDKHLKLQPKFRTTLELIYNKVDLGNDDLTLSEKIDAARRQAFDDKKSALFKAPAPKPNIRRRPKP